MNILSLIFAVLLILGIFTHAQFESYTQFVSIRAEYDDYIKHRERQYFNTRQMKLYESIKSSKPNKEEPNPEKEPKKHSSSRLINFRLILDEELRKGNQEASDQHLFMATELARQLFQNTGFYKDIEKDRPNFLEEMFQLIIETAKGHSFQYVEDLDKIYLPDSELRYVFYNMLLGAQKQEKKTEKQKEIEPEPVPVSDEEAEEEEEKTEGPEEKYVPENNTVSLKAYIHFKPNLKLIKVYLAPRELLQTIFGSEEAANQIIAKREELYHLVKNKKIVSDIATQQFVEFKSMKRQEIKDETLDFTVTTTDPRKYR